MPSQLDFFQSSLNQERQVQIAAQQAKIAADIALQQEKRNSARQSFNAAIEAFEQTLASTTNVHQVCHDLIYKAKQIASVSNLSRIETLTQIIEWANQSQKGLYEPNSDLRDILLNEISKASIFDRPYVQSAAGFLGVMISFAIAMFPFIFANPSLAPFEIITFVITFEIVALFSFILSILEMKAPPCSVGLEVRQLSEMFEVPAELNQSLDSPIPVSR